MVGYTADTIEKVRDDFVPKDAYVSKDYAQVEAETLWPRVWQLACREEEIPNIGDFVVYDILHDSLIITRVSDNRIKAFFNVCPHRGRRLLNGAGKCSTFQCFFHGWRWNLEGENIKVVDRDDWRGGLSDSEIRLQEALVGTWGGNVFVNMDPDAEALESFLAPVIARCDKFEFEKMRYRWENDHSAGKLEIGIRSVQ
jgi:phenylpropionate dioxygenase-like ring-hydroxylating dioxygenase large terminal subunit